MSEPSKSPTIRELAYKTAVDFISYITADRSPISDWGFALEEDHESALLIGHALSWSSDFLYTECLNQTLAKEVSQVLFEVGIEQIAEPFPEGTGIAIYKKG